MVNYNQHGLAISTHTPRAGLGKNAYAASQEVKLVPVCFHVANQAQDSAPLFPSPSPILDGLPCAIPPGANLTGGGVVTRPQSPSFQSADHLHDQLASGFPSQVSSLPRGVQP